MSYFGFIGSLLPALRLKLCFMKDEVFEHLIQPRTVLLHTSPGSNAVPEQVVDFVSPPMGLHKLLELKQKNVPGRVL